MKYFNILFLILFSLPLFADDQGVAIVNGKIYTMAGAPIEKGTILIRGTKIEAVGTNLNVPSGYRTIDASGKLVFPGFIDPNCRVGLEEISQVTATVDTTETIDPVTPQLRTIDGFFPESKTIGVTRSNGVVAGIVAPGEVNIFAGASGLIEFSGKQLSDVILQERTGMHVTLGEAPKLTYAERKKLPSTRMGNAALLRQTLQKATEYGSKWKRHREKSKDKQKKGDDEKGAPEWNGEMEALQDVLSGKLPLIVSAHRVDDILTALRVAKEFGLEKNLVINHGTDAYKIADTIARERVPVIVGPVTSQPDRPEREGAIYENAALLHKAGILIAIQSNEAHNARNLPYEAGLAVANGLPYEEALKAITINPARIFRVDSQVGSIEAGKRANLIISDGDPLEPRTRINHILIGGEEITTDSYHQDLWEEFQKQ